MPFVTADVIHKLIEHKSVNIFITPEGPSCENIGLYRLLDYITSTFNVNKKSITIVTANLLEKHSEYNIQYNPQMPFIERMRKFSTGLQTDKNKNALKHFGHFIRRSTWERLWISSHLYANHKDKSIFTYQYIPGLDAHKEHLGFDTLSYELCSSQHALKITNDLLSNVPFTDTVITDDVVYNPTDLVSKYDNFLVEITGETFVTGKVFFANEKTWRPVAMRTPFISQSSQNHIANLQRLGFKTFSQWWDESYDWKSGKDKIIAITEVIDYLAQKSQTELVAMYVDMLPTLNYNYELLQELTAEQMLKANYVN